MKILFKLFVVLLVFSTCKEVPSFIDDNIYDPESSSYMLESPSKLTLNPNSDFTAVSWNRLQSTYVTGYQLFRSHIDSLHYEKIADVPRSRDYFNDQEAGNPINIYYKLRAYFVQESDTIFSEPIYSKKNYSITNFDQSVLESGNKVYFDIESSFTENSYITIEQKLGTGEFTYLTEIKANPWSNRTYTYSELPTEEITYRAFVENSYEKTDYYLSRAYAQINTFPKVLEVLESTEYSAEIKIDPTSEVDEIILFKNVYDSWEFYPDKELIARYPSSQTSIVIEGLSQETSNRFFLHVRKGGFISTGYYPITLSNYDGSTWTLSTHYDDYEP